MVYEITAIVGPNGAVLSWRINSNDSAQYVLDLARRMIVWAGHPMPHEVHVSPCLLQLPSAAELQQS
jgi:hypothetical protein